MTVFYAFIAFCALSSGECSSLQSEQAVNEAECHRQIGQVVERLIALEQQPIAIARAVCIPTEEHPA